MTEDFGGNDMSYTLETTANLPDDKVISYSIKDKKPWRMRFRPLGTINWNHTESIEALDYICDFNKGELALLRVVSKKIEQDYRFNLRLKDYPKPERARLKRAIPLWIEKGILLRIKHEFYMVNPWFLIPPKQEQVKAMDYWKALNHKC